MIKASLNRYAGLLQRRTSVIALLCACALTLAAGPAMATNSPVYGYWEVPVPDFPTHGTAAGRYEYFWTAVRGWHWYGPAPGNYHLHVYVPSGNIQLLQGDFGTSFGPGGNVVCGEYTSDTRSGLFVVTPFPPYDPPDHCDSNSVHDAALSTDPINLVSGDMISRATDIFIPCPGINLEFTRQHDSWMTYNSSRLGPHWRHTYEWNCWSAMMVTDWGPFSTTNSWAQIATSDGHLLNFPYPGETDVWRNFGDNDWVVRLYPAESTRYKLFMSKGMVRGFNSSGALISISDSRNNIVTISYSNSLISHVEHSNGQYLDFGYYTNSRLASVTTPSTNLSVSYHYDDNWRLTNVIRTTSVGSTSTEYGYDSSNCMTSRVNAAGDTWTYLYNTNSRPQCTNLSINGAGYYQHTVEYDDGASTVSYAVRGTNQTYKYLYDTNTYKITKIYGPGPTNLTKSFHFATLYGNVTNLVIKDSATGEWLEKRSKFGGSSVNPSQQAFGYNALASNYWQYVWDNTYDVPTSIIDPEGGKSTFVYDDGNLLTSSVHYNGSGGSYDTQFGYTTNGLLLAVTNANNHWVRYNYDSYGYPTSAVPQLGPTVSYQYSQLGYLTNISLPGASGARVVGLDVTELGSVHAISYPNGESESFSYDSVLNMTNHVDSAGRRTRYTYAPTHRLTSIIREMTGGAEITNSLVYDQQFNTLNIRDAKGRIVEAYAMDIQDRPTTVTNVEQQTMTISYGLVDYVNRVIRFDGTSVTNQYDTDGRLFQVGYPGSTNTFRYYKNNLLKTAGSELGVITNLYNFANRLTNSVCVAPSGGVSYSYLPAGQIASVASVLGTVAYSFDAAERVSSIQSPMSAFNSSYNAYNGLLAGVTCTNSGVEVEYGFDVMDRVTNIVWKDVSETVLRGFAYWYNNAGMITNVTLQDGSVLLYEYDDLDRLTGEKRIDSSSETIYDTTYSYDAVGNRTEKSRNGATVTYTHPYGASGNRLMRWTATSTNSFAGIAVIDVAGSSSETIGTNPSFGQLYVSNSVAVTPEVDGTNFLAFGISLSMGTQEIVAAIGDVAGNVGYATSTVVVTVLTNADYSYSSAGCLTQAVYSGSAGYSRTTAIEWNEQYQITSVLTNGAVAESYQYDALGRRVSIASGGTTNWLVYDGIHVIAEVDAAGVLKNSYTWNPQAIDHLLAFTDYTGGETNTYYALTDHLGTVHALTDESGSIVEGYRLDAWGRVLGVYDSNGQPLSESAIGNHYLHQGRWYSWKTGLYFHRNRWRDPITGRWLSKDPIGISGGLNQYEFCRSNPVNFIDPDGLDIWVGKGSSSRGGPIGALHRNINIGDPNGKFVSYSYGTDSSFAVLNPFNKAGEVYRDDCPRKIDKDRYLKTTPKQDAYARWIIAMMLNDHTPYRLFGSNCRSWVNSMFEFFSEDMKFGQ